MTPGFFPSALLQLIVIIFLIAQIALAVVALIYLRRQGLSERQLLVWDVIVLFVPFGAFLAYFYFQGNRRR